ncbi:Type II/IV secretion system protein TadC, associated with Flp pilus assembly [Serinicoccus hydrothermalis]|uniref:Type II/IV secretion system protein TadC, associated with Flp pilus assembly n=1 Tax=Serinicoccus hydrothermalis TaxID=1758689 RepID=A0A1B1NGL7_9MICO|nr:type II secretion system F family protein [Serinicoccus hydrothermalis]ANS80565.1 Type II/IV secretion system protein TadC, associated with Flp pilus assembly [Serinicoccus hydrothermalis]
MSPAWWGAVLGLTFGVGLVLMWAGLPLARRVDLADRIEPYLDRPPRRSRLLALDDPRPWEVSDLLAPVTRRAARLLDRALGGTDSVRSRLHRAGLTGDVEGFRVQQVVWGVLAAAAAVLLGTLLWFARGTSPGIVLLLVGSAFLGGVMGRDWMLSRAAARRERQIMAEFPAVAELLALSITAGEGTAQALERVARLSRGELAAELDLCLAQARTGASLPEALQGLGRRTGIAPIVRFVDGLVVALQRGTPLGEVLRAQAADAREAARQQLIEEGGKREITMMIPVVFLILPVTVLFAVFPGVVLLRLSL